MDPIKLTMDIIGWIGAFSLLLPYFLISKGIVHGKSWVYQSLNLLGGTGLLINSYYYNAMPSVFVNITWVIIGIYTLTTFFGSRNKGKIND